jgi:hypothetical protein
MAVRRAALVVVLAVFAGCSGDDGPSAATGTPFERPAYRFVVPAGWRSALDDDPSTEEQVVLEGKDPMVIAFIWRDPAREDVRVGLQRQIDQPPSNQLEVTSVKRYGLDVGGEATWFLDAAYDSARARSIGFEHGGYQYGVELRVPVPGRSFELQADAVDGLLHSWEFTGRG